MLSFLLAVVAPCASPGTPADVALTENDGQWPAHVAFVGEARSGPRRVLVRAEVGAVVLEVQDRPARERVVARVEFGGGEEWRPVGVDERPEKHHSYIGQDPEQWVRNARAFERVVFVDASGVERAELSIASDGVKIVERAAGSWRGARIVARDALERVLGHDAVRESPGELAVAFDVGFVWATYLGGAMGGQESLMDVAVSPSHPKRVAACGWSNADDFPLTPGTYSNWIAGQLYDAATVTCFDAASGQIQWSAKIGSTAVSHALAVDFDAAGHVVIAGFTSSHSFPTTPAALQPVHGGTSGRGFAVKFLPDGSDLVYSTYIGGAAVNGSAVNALRVRPDGVAVVAGETAAQAEFPITPGAFQTQPGGQVDAFVSALAADGASLEWSTFLGAEKLDWAQAVALGPDGTVTVVGIAGSAHFPTTPGAFVWNKPPIGGSGGQAIFFTRLSADGASLVWSGMIGWSHIQDPFVNVAVGQDGRVLVSGRTFFTPIPLLPSSLQPTIHGTSDGFLMLLSPDGKTLLASTYFGGPASEMIRGATFDGSGVVTFGGSAGLPGGWVTEPPIGLAPTGGAATMYRLAPDLSRVLYGQLFGGAAPQSGITVGIGSLPQGEAAVAGRTFSPNSPTTPGAFQPNHSGGGDDGFVLRHRMLPSGVHRMGRSGPACAADAYLAATGPAKAGNDAFALYASNLPPNAAGVLAIGVPSDTPTWLPGGPAIHVRLDAPLVVLPWDSGPMGYHVLDLPLPPGVAGLEVAAQIVVVAPGPCDAPGWAWTHALRIAIAP